MQKAADIERSSLSLAILHTVAYADVFDYPLTEAELHRYLTGLAASPESIRQALCDDAFLRARLKRLDEYIFLAGREQIVARRARRERIAARLWPQARRYGRLIAALPFVRMVAVTGSLAMDNVDEGADLDYLVVARSGRLWLCRALILALGRLAELQGLRLCPNYIISERALEFPDQSLYSAHELAQMVPLAGLEVYERIRALNPWVRRFLPNTQDAPARAVPAAGNGPSLALQAVLEALLLGPAADRLERWEMERKIRKLRAENGDNPEASFSVDLCKGHFNRHGQKTEYLLQQKLEGLSLERV